MGSLTFFFRLQKDGILVILNRIAGNEIIMGLLGVIHHAGLNEQEDPCVLNPLIPAFYIMLCYICLYIVKFGCFNFFLSNVNIHVGSAPYIFFLLYQVIRI